MRKVLQFVACRENHDRLQNWGKQQRKQCIVSYDGAAYKGLRANFFDQEDLTFAQGHLRIISGMYGLLKPLDMIEPYR